VVDKSKTVQSDPDKSEDAKSDKEILELARERFKVASDAEADIRRESLDDRRFHSGEQWDEQVKAKRANKGRPCLVINRLPQSTRQITNDQRQNRPAIKVFPVDDVADPETAKIFQGVIKHIEYDSQADTAYDTSFDSAVVAGFGYFRIITEYEDHMSFNQKILIKRIRNPLTVYKDPGSTEPDGSDMNWCFIVDDLTKEEFKEQYPKADLLSLEEFHSVGDSAASWMPGGKVRIAEYFYKEYEEKKIHLLSNGQVAEDGVPLAPGITIKDSRVAQVPVIKWCKLSGAEIIEKREWLGMWIPVIPVIGEEIDVDGKLILKGIVRDSKDPQRMYNYWKSTETETIALAPRAPFIGAAGQFTGHESKWNTANNEPHAFLEYNPKDIQGVALPPPQRQTFEPAIQAITMAGREAAEDIKATTGIYDASLGGRSNETSGIAIQRRNNQAQTSNYHFVDNLTRSLRHAGRILVDLIPKIYDTPRAARIIGEEGEQEIVRINQLFEKDGQIVQYNLGVGKYDVVIETGPNFATKRQEAAQSMLDMSGKNPLIMQAAGDLMVKAMDWPMKDEVSERLKKMLPPQLQDAPDGQTPLPPQVQQQLQQQGDMVKQLTDALHAAHDVIDQKKIEIESKERIEMAKIQAQIEMKMADLGSKESIELLYHQVEEIKHRLQLLNVDQPIDQEGAEQPQPDQSQFEQAQPEMAAPQDPTGGASPGLTVEPNP
jgi:hypothetical protein